MQLVATKRKLAGKPKAEQLPKTEILTPPPSAPSSPLEHLRIARATVAAEIAETERTILNLEKLKADLENRKNVLAAIDAAIEKTQPAAAEIGRAATS